MDDAQEVRQLELLCKQLYESQDSSHRAEAEKALVGFQNAPDTLAKCQLLLDRGDSPYAQLLAATTLTKLVTRSAQGLSLQQRLDIREWRLPARLHEKLKKKIFLLFLLMVLMVLYKAAYFYTVPFIFFI